MLAAATQNELLSRLSGAPLWLILAGIGTLAIWAWSRLRARRKPGASRLGSDLKELGERLAAEMDARAERLERLIAQADDRLARLEGGAGREPSNPASAARRPSASRAVAEAKAPTSRGARIEVSTELDPLHRRVYDLADGGLAPVEIARELDEHVGKVQLILALRSE